MKWDDEKNAAIVNFWVTAGWNIFLEKKKCYLTEMKMCTCVNLRARQQSEEMDCRHAPWYIDMDLFAHFSALSLPLSPQEGPKAWLRLIHDWAPLTSSNAHSTLSPPFLLFKPLRLSIFRVIFFSLNFMFISKRFRSTFLFFFCFHQESEFGWISFPPLSPQKSHPWS